MVKTFEESMSMNTDMLDVPVSRAPVNHNAADYERFHRYMSEVNNRYRQVERKERLKAIQKNLELWDSQTPSRWRGASLSKDSSPEASTILDMIKNGPRGGSFFIAGSANSKRTHLAYSIIRKMIAQGVTTPSQVCTLSEDKILSLSNAGFSGRDRLNSLLSSQYNLYLLDGVGSKPGYTERESATYEEVIDHIYNKDLTAVITSPLSIGDFTQKFSETFESRVTELIENRKMILRDTLQGVSASSTNGNQRSTRQQEQRGNTSVRGFNDFGF